MAIAVAVAAEVVVVVAVLAAAAASAGLIVDEDAAPEFQDAPMAEMEAAVTRFPQWVGH